METHYRHSGRVTPLGLLAGLATGVIVSLPAAQVYNYGIIHIPEAKLRCICTMAFGALMGVCSGLILAWGKIRNGVAAGIVGLSASVAGLYVSWVTWILTIFQSSQVTAAQLFTRPMLLWKAVLFVNTRGTWAMEHGAPTTGMALWIVWVCEAALVLGCAVVAAIALVNRLPFCEKCEQWCSKRASIVCAPKFSAAHLRSKLEGKQFECLQEVVPGNRKMAHFRIDLHSCTSCGTLNTLSLIQNFPKDRKTVMHKLIVTAAEADHVAGLSMASSAITTAAVTSAGTR